MKHFRNFVVIALCVSLFANFNALAKLDVLENRVNSISNNQNQVLSSVSSQTSNIRSVISDLKKEQSWLSPISMTTKTTDLDQGKAVLRFEWQVKELNNNSEVVFNYKYRDEEQYASLNAVNKGSGLFEMTIPIEVVFEPEWRVVISDSSDTRSELNEKSIEEKYKEDQLNQFSINYFVTVAHNDTLKSSDINETYVGNLGGQHYGFLEIFTNISKDNNSVSVTGSSNYNETSAILQKVYLKKYKNGQLLDEEKLVSSDISDGDKAVRENARTFHTESLEEKTEYDSLVVKVTYNDGATFEREIYSR